MSSDVTASPKRRASSNSSQKQQSTLVQAFSKLKKPRTEAPMQIDLTKSPMISPNQTNGRHRATVKQLTIHNLVIRKNATRETEYYEATFGRLAQAMDTILAGETEHSYQQLYKACENLVRGGHSARCATMASEKMETHIVLRCTDLVHRIQQGESALNGVVNAWTQWNEVIHDVRGILFYLDRTYLSSSSVKTPGRCKIADLATNLFREKIVYHSFIKEEFIKDLLKTFEEVRLAPSATHPHLSKLRTVMQLITHAQLYESYFESPFLSSSEEFFKNEAATSCTLPVPGRLDLISNRIQSETILADQLLRPATKIALLGIVRQQLLKLRINELLEGFDSLMESRDMSKLKHLFNLISSVDELASMINAFANFVKKSGLQILSDKANDKTMVESLLVFKEEMDKILGECFETHDLFFKALRDQFSAFINSRGDVPAEMMAKYIDSVLRSGNKKFDERDLDNQMSRLMDIFRFIASKDVFEAFYKKDLAKRLLLNKSASSDAERSLLGKLKVECGATFTHKLEGMFKDVDISRDYGKNFPNKNLDVFVLSQGSWPTYPEVQAKIPETMKEALQEFQHYYLKSNKGRKLMWRHSLGHCQIKATFPKGDKDLMVSLFQGIVILLFNGTTSLPYKTIQEQTGLDITELTRTLQSLACGKPETRILLKHPKGKDVNDTDVFRVNDNFQNPKRIVKINQIQMKETAEENKATHERIIQDRSFEIQAAIMRIMKSAKVKTHAELIANVIDTTKGRGVPHIPDIKKAIEKLLDREYLSRQDKEYRYEA